MPEVGREVADSGRAKKQRLKKGRLRRTGTSVRPCGGHQVKATAKITLSALFVVLMMGFASATNGSGNGNGNGDGNGFPGFGVRVGGQE